MRTILLLPALALALTCVTSAQPARDDHATR